MHLKTFCTILYLLKNTAIYMVQIRNLKNHPWIQYTSRIELSWHKKMIVKLQSFFLFIIVIIVHFITLIFSCSNICNEAREIMMCGGVVFWRLRNVYASIVYDCKRQLFLQKPLDRVWHNPLRVGKRGVGGMVVWQSNHNSFQI